MKYSVIITKYTDEPVAFVNDRYRIYLKSGLIRDAGARSPGAFPKYVEQTKGLLFEADTYDKVRDYLQIAQYINKNTFDAEKVSCSFDADTKDVSFIKQSTVPGIDGCNGEYFDINTAIEALITDYGFYEKWRNIPQKEKDLFEEIAERRAGFLYKKFDCLKKIVEKNVLRFKSDFYYHDIKALSSAALDGNPLSYILLVRNCGTHLIREDKIYPVDKEYGDMITLLSYYRDSDKTAKYFLVQAGKDVFASEIKDITKFIASKKQHAYI